MYEVELKVRAEHDPVRDTLEEKGATSLGMRYQSDTYYDAPHRNFVETDEALRIRHEREQGEETTHLTYKGPRIDDESKTREEYETTVADSEAMEGILEGLGFEPAATVEKQRERYSLDEFSIVLDDVTDLGTFVEVETDVQTESAVDQARSEAQQLLADIGLDPDEGIRTSYLGLLVRNNSE